jgi:hypothetical protein
MGFLGDLSDALQQMEFRAMGRIVQVAMNPLGRG